MLHASKRQVLNADFITEIVQQLGKNYAFALVGIGSGGTALMDVIDAHPGNMPHATGIASFLAVSEPSLPLVERCQTVPTPDPATL